MKNFALLAIIVAFCAVSFAQVVTYDKQQAEQLKALHEKMIVYHGDRLDTRGAMHRFHNVDNRLYSIFMVQKEMSYCTQIGDKTLYVTSLFEKQSDEKMIVHYTYRMNAGDRSKSLRYRVEYEQTPSSNGSRMVFEEDDARGWGKECFKCLLKCVGTGTGCGLCIAAPTCWGTWGVGCLACIGPCTAALAICIDCDVCF